MIHEETIPKARSVVLEALEHMHLPIHLSLAHIPPRLSSTLAVFEVKHVYLGTLGNMTFRDLGNDRTKISCLTGMSSVEEAIQFEARAQTCLKLVNKESLQLAMSHGQDEREAAIDLYLHAQEFYELNVGRVDQILAILEKLPVAEQALQVFTDRRIEEIPAIARRFIQRVEPLNMNGKHVSLFDCLIKQSHEMEIIQELSSKTTTAQRDLDLRKIQQCERLVASLFNVLRRDEAEGTGDELISGGEEASKQTTLGRKELPPDEPKPQDYPTTGAWWKAIFNWDKRYGRQAGVTTDRQLALRVGMSYGHVRKMRVEHGEPRRRNNE